MQVFAEVILGKAEEIFENDIDLNMWFIQKELVTILSRSKPVDRKILATNPPTKERYEFQLKEYQTVKQTFPSLYSHAHN